MPDIIFHTASDDPIDDLDGDGIADSEGDADGDGIPDILVATSGSNDGVSMAGNLSLYGLRIGTRKGGVL